MRIPPRSRSLLPFVLPVLGLALALPLEGCGAGGGAGGSGSESEGSGDDDGDGGGGGGSGGGGGTAAGPADVRVLAANDLGMHCMDREFSVFSILPPFNVVRAQAIRRETSGVPTVLTSADVDLTYEGVADAHGSINTKSAGKTDFWTHATGLFGATLSPGEGLTGLYMPGDAPVKGPQALRYDATKQWWYADGIPITPRDDGGGVNTYPLIRIAAREKGTGRELAHLDVVVPVAQETDCSNCHRTGALAAKGAGVTWSTDADLEIQTKRNVLLLHDAKQGTNLMASQPVLCASCHYSPALDLAGAGPQGPQQTIPFFSAAMHAYHGTVTDAAGAPVFPADGTANATCYQCHPGAVTQCARGAMKTGGLECRDCHGGMKAVGGVFPQAVGGSLDGTRDGKSRRPWADLPRCQSCHTGDALTHLVGGGVVLAPDGIRLAQAWRTGDAAASAISAPASRFAENAGTLSRFSKGHGGLNCQNCHGSTHAEWPNETAGANDNVAATELQGHTGVLMECTACHLSGTLARTTQGPHGLHNVNDPGWANGGHSGAYENNPNGCKACHGADLRGTVLSKTPVDRTFNVEDAGTVRLPKGTKVGCNHCHGIPR